MVRAAAGCRRAVIGVWRCLWCAGLEEIGDTCGGWDPQVRTIGRKGKSSFPVGEEGSKHHNAPFAECNILVTPRHL